MATLPPIASDYCPPFAPFFGLMGVASAVRFYSILDVYATLSMKKHSIDGSCNLYETHTRCCSFFFFFWSALLIDALQQYVNN